MPLYFASDVHLRLDRPERSLRFARWVDGLGAGDELIIVGDLCDFWFGSRQSRGDPSRCAGLRALADLSARGGTVVVQPGNHDTWLGPLYERSLGLRYEEGEVDVRAEGLRIRSVHGHLLGARSRWKGAMEGRAFLHAFAALPGPLARGLEATLNAANESRRLATTRKHLTVFRQHADTLAGRADLVVYGHLHQSPLLEARPSGILMAVLGDWIHYHSYLVVEPGGHRLVAEPLADSPAGSASAS